MNYKNLMWDVPDVLLHVLQTENSLQLNHLSL